jgi:ABC-type bacteriocin/lantibiotic exporter with double-glycine peptidase domain
LSDWPLLPSLGAEAAAARLLALLGVPGEPYAAPAAEADEPAERVLGLLAAHGVHGRLARLDMDELRHAGFPTLVRLKDTRWLLVLRLDRQGAIAEDAFGKAHEVSLKRLAEAFGGQVLDRIAELPPGNTLWSRVLRLVWAHRRMLYQAGVLALLAQGLSLIVPQLARLLVDQAFPAGASNLLPVIIAGMVLVALFQAWTGWLERRVALFLQTRLDAVLERGLLVHVMRISYKYLEQKTLGQLMQAFEGIATTRDLLTGQSMTAMLGGVTALAFLVLMAQLMPAPTAVVAAIGIITMTVVIVVGRRQERLQQHFVELLVRERGYAVELFTHIAMLKAAAAEHLGVDRWLEMLRRERATGLRGERLTLGSHTAVDLLGQAQLQGLWIWGGLRVLEGSLQLGELIAFTLMASAFHAAIGGLGRTLVMIWTAKPHLRETQLLLKQEPRPLAPRRALPPAPGAVEVRDLWFRYGDDLPWVFAGLNLVVEPGELRHIEGPSGFGKTTLLKLVAGLYEPARGSIRVSGETPQAARERVAYLPQFVRLFDASILENLRIFSGGAALDQLMATAELTGLAKLVDELPMGYDTLLAQGGENFSGGQRQLIALTAVLASAKRILLLDEAMANLDPVRRAGLVCNPLLENKTILYTSHDVYRLSGRKDCT